MILSNESEVQTPLHCVGKQQYAMYDFVHVMAKIYEQLLTSQQQDQAQWKYICI